MNEILAYPDSLEPDKDKCLDEIKPVLTKDTAHIGSLTRDMGRARNPPDLLVVFRAAAAAFDDHRLFIKQPRLFEPIQ